MSQSDDNTPRRRTSSVGAFDSAGLEKLNVSNNKLSNFPERLACVAFNLQS